jgi:hypothetical protein
MLGEIAALIAILTSFAVAVRYVVPRAHCRYRAFRFNRLPLVERLVILGIKREHAERAVVEKGLTAEDVEWNKKLSRPLNWKETLDLDEEARRRAAYDDQQALLRRRP